MYIALPSWANAAIESRAAAAIANIFFISFFDSLIFSNLFEQFPGNAESVLHRRALHTFLNVGPYASKCTLEVGVGLFRAAECVLRFGIEIFARMVQYQQAGGQGCSNGAYASDYSEHIPASGRSPPGFERRPDRTVKPFRNLDPAVVRYGFEFAVTQIHYVFKLLHIFWLFPFRFSDSFLQGSD